MPVVSVSRPRGSENVAWRVWAVSPKDFKHRQDVVDEALDFMISNNLVTIGFNNDSLAEYPATWPKFKAVWSDRVSPTHSCVIPYWFAQRMKKGDLIILARKQKYIEAYGYLADSELRYVDKKHPLYRKVMRLQNLTNDVFAGLGEPDLVECFRNFRLVDEWIRFDGPPRTASGKLSGSIKPTIAAVSMQEGLHWLGQADAPEHFSKAKKASGQKQKGRKSSKPGPFAGPNLSDLTESAVKEALLHYELHRRDELPTEDPAKAPFVIKYDGKLYQPWPVIMQATTDEFRKKFPYEPPRSPLCQRLLALGFPVVRHPKASG